MSSSQSFSSDFYNSLAYGGRIYNNFTSVICLVICLVAVYFGVVLITKEYKYTIQNIGMVIGLMNSKQVPQFMNTLCTDPDCKQYKINNQQTTSCSFRVMYTDKDGILNLSNVISGSFYEVKAGDNIPIFINKNDKLDVSLITDNYKNVGWFLVIFAVVLFFISIRLELSD